MTTDKNDTIVVSVLSARAGFREAAEQSRRQAPVVCH